jgi:hypothetical protein
MFRFIIVSIALLACSVHAASVFGHGFDVSVDNPPSLFTITSAQPYYDLADPTDPSNAPYPTAGPSNLFLDAFDGDANPDGSYGTFEGFAQTSGPFPPYSGATFNILSPLYFSDGTGPAVPASSGTYLHIYDLYAGNSDGSHPGASSGDVYIYGNTSFLTGFGVSLTDHHELQKDIYLAAGSTQTYGEYGFAFDVIVPFSNGTTLNTGPLFDVFALDITTDPNNPDGFATFASFDQQDAATEAIVAALVPEPSAFLLAVSGGGLLVANRLRRKASKS